MHDQSHQENDSNKVPRSDEAIAFKSFEIADLASNQVATPTGMREEILLLSWLIVLLRTSEGGQISFDWSYSPTADLLTHRPTIRHLSRNKVMTGSQVNVGEVAGLITRELLTVDPSQRVVTSDPCSLLLSTNALSQMSEEAKNESNIHLELHFSNGNLSIRPIWYTITVPEFTVTQHIDVLVDIVRMCASTTDISIEKCLRPTGSDLDAIWRWNHLLPPTHKFCMHEMISERVREYPEKVAISSWDGSLTYDQIEQYSMCVASSLIDMGVKLHDFVPVCFEKSRWTIVAMLAVMKVGATFLLMDPTLPLARLQNMAEQVGAKTMVSSRKQHDLSSSIIPGVDLIVVEADAFAHLPSPQAVSKLPTVPSSSLMYIIFTSGSTGTPKGVQISHETYTSSAIPRAKAVGYTEKSRVLDFASYAFDVSIDSMLLTLGNGGCLCIPSDEDRLNDINEVMRKMRINYAGITPSVARILDPDVIASLDGLGLGGEAASASDVTLWGLETRIIIGYGPCECTIGCTVNSSAATGRNYVSIGIGNGAAIWIVDPNNHDSLMPVGAVGELLVEGPIVGQGYFNDPDKTAAAFIEDPPWLVAGHQSYNGRKGRLYKTGDLGRFDPDGSGGIVFAGRKDTQVKLRGQRVELGEIESQLKAKLPADVNIIAEVIVPQGSGGQLTLVAFIALQSAKGHIQTDISLVQLLPDTREALTEANAYIAKVLPRYMVPTAYIPVKNIPVLISGKTDRKRLREFGSTVDLRQLDLEQDAMTIRELSDLELRVRQAWSLVLKVNEEAIGPADNFFALGGDSVSVMRLVSVCRVQGLDLSVMSAFDHPTLATMAGVVKECDTQVRNEISAFSMILQPADSACIEASQACGTVEDSVEDVYPSTPTQESLFTFSLKSTKPYIAQRVACIPSDVDISALKRAWEIVVAGTPILRTRLVQLQEPGLQQVVLKENISWRYSSNLVQYLENDRQEKMDLGQDLARYAIIHHAGDGKQYMVWTVHHVLYDGWSEPLVLQQVRNVLQDQPLETNTQMRDFVRFVHNIDTTEIWEFWSRELEGAVGPQFPRLPSRDYLPIPDTMLERQINFKVRAGFPFTMATLIRGAWALVASQYTASDDVVFGETLTGRDIPVPGVEHIVGPLIATVPVRIKVQKLGSVESYLQGIQRRVSARTMYQHMGMQNIRKVSRDAQHACEAGTGLVFQPEAGYVGNDLGFSQGDVVLEALHFNPYPLMLACGMRKDGFRVCANFDSGLVELAQMQRMLAQLEEACSQLSEHLSRRLEDIRCLPKAELDQIWQWNQEPPLQLEESSHRLRAHAHIKQGSRYPPAVVSWVCDPRKPSLLSPIGCVGELWLEGAYLSGESVETPAWLLAGSSSCPGRIGKVQPTGDMVQLREDGSLVFVGRKDDLSPVQGHAVDIAELERHLSRYLPATTRAAAVVHRLSTDSIQTTRSQGLVVFVEQLPSQEDKIQVMPAYHNVSCDNADLQNFETTVPAKIPISLAVALKKLDKFVQDSLAAYMAPSAYMVIEKMPTDTGVIDRSALNQLASSIPQSVFAQLHDGLIEAWTQNLAQSHLTPAEYILQSSWSKVLGISPEKIDVDDNFFRLGGDSVLAMKMVSNLRVQGHGLTVADIFQRMRLSDAARVLKMNQVSKVKGRPYRPFSTLGNLDMEAFFSEIVQPQLADSSWSIQDITPVTETQAFDIRATIQRPRTSIQYTMLYFDLGVDRQRLFRACEDLVKVHDILRTVFIEHDSRFFQVVLNEPNNYVVTQQADKEIDQYVADLCTADIESDYQLGSPFLKLFHVEGSDGRECLILGLSHAQYDGISLPRLLQDLETLYLGEKVVDYKPFPWYISRTRAESVRDEALIYWRELLSGSSLSVLGGKSIQHTDKAVFKEKTVHNFQRHEEITTASYLSAAWALLLARRLETTDVTFGGVTSGRNINLQDVENVMGPCHQFTPIRVSFESHWTAIDLLRFVQGQAAQSSVHDFVGFETISRQCTQWAPEARFYDSMVHHQDADDFDTMPFAGEHCKVDISNPHGDSAYPLKAVSFVRGGELHIGVVGSERDPVFVEIILKEMVATIQELAIGDSEHGLLVDQTT